MIFFTRLRAAEFLSAAGIPVKPASLADMASRGVGPKYRILNGRAVYREEDLLAWIEAQAPSAGPIGPTRRAPATASAA